VLVVALDALDVRVASAGDGLPERVSPSQMAVFGSCPLRYYFRHVLGWQEKPSAASVTGTLVHDTLEQLYRLAREERTAERADRLLRDLAPVRFQRPENAEFAKDSDVATGAITGVQNLFVLEQPSDVDVAPDGLEADVTAVLNGVSFGGRLDRRTDGVVPRITDYKSSRRPAPAYLQDKLRQLYLYAAGEIAAGREIAEVELLYLGGHPARVRRPVFDAVIADAVNALAQMRTASEQALASSTFAARRSRLCNYCSFRRACPLFATSAPPPGTDDSNTVLTGTGLGRRTPRPRPEPLEALDDAAEDEMQA
jgi:putative RecB family exonuclease